MQANQKQLSLHELSSYLDGYLDPFKIDEAAPNGVQVANMVAISKIATAVSASVETIEKAVQLKVQALIVHHGTFLKYDPYQITGIKYKKIKLLMDNDIALLGYHLPLDAHREVGNNWKAAMDLGLNDLQPFAPISRVDIGVVGTIQPTSFEDFTKKVEQYYGNRAAAVKVKDIVSKVAIISGGADKFIKAAAQAGADCFITGRFDEPVWDDAHDENISFLGLGHYATEVVGPKALAQHLQAHFGIPCEFIKTDNPF
jgi:dinuclear metal center YbgI/SA1388 family protein